MVSLRLKKIAKLYQHELSSIIFTVLDNPHVQGVRINNVMFTPDMREARVYFFVDGGIERQKEVLKGLKTSKGFLKKELAQRVRLRYSPNLTFFYDESEDEQARIDALLDKIDEENKNKIPED